MSGETSNKDVFLGFSTSTIVFLSIFFLPISGLAQEKSTHQTLGSSACEKCHKPQNEWWPKNNHYQTAEPFFDQKGKQVKIARLYGINPSDMTKGNILCMRCHGTIVSGSEKDSVTDGVGCEACHGPAKDYLKPHQEGEKSLGDNRPGRVKGLQLGMVNLRDLKTRVKNCGRCHNISDARLLSAGHPSATNFIDYFVDGMAKTRHWTRALDSPDELGKAYHEAFPAAGGNPPEKTVAPAEHVAPTNGVAPKTTASLQTPSPTPGAVSVEGGSPPTLLEKLKTEPPEVLATPSLPKPLPPVPRPVPIAAFVPAPTTPSLPDEKGVPLPPLPKIDKTTSVEEILLIVKERLDLLHRTVHKEP